MDKKEGDSTKHSSRSEKKIRVESELSKKAMLEAVLKKIDYYANKNTVTDLDLYYLMREFFRSFLEIKYEFSFDELISELDKIYLETKQREEVVNFINKVKLIEYQDAPFKEDKIKEFIKHFAELSKNLVKAGTVEKQTFWKRLKAKFKKEAPPVYEEYTSASQETFSIKKEEKKKETSPEPEKDEETSDLENVTENTFETSGKRVDDSTAEELNKYKQDEPKKKNSKTSSDTPDLASIEAHNRMVLGKTDDEEQKQPYVKTENHSKKEKKSKDKLKDKKTKKDSKLKNKPQEVQNQTQSENTWDSEKPDMQLQDNTVKEKPEDLQMTAVPNQENSVSEQKIQEEKNKTKSTAKTNTAGKSKRIAKKEEKKKQKKIQKKESKTSKKEKQKNNSKKKTSSAKPVKEKTEKKDIDSLIKKAKKSVKKEEITNLYKQINELYNKGDVKFKSKYYKSVMDIYKKISKIK